MPARLGVRGRILLATGAIVAVASLVVARLVSGRIEAAATMEQAHAELRWGLGLGLASAVAAALLVGLAAAFVLTRRVRSLTETALALGNGELERRCDESGGDELGQLGVAINKLAGELTKSIGDIRDDRDLLASILDGMSEGVLVTDGDDQIVLANRALRAMTVVPEQAVGRTIYEALRKNVPVLSLLEEATSATSSIARELEVGRVLLRKLRVHVSRLHGGDGGLVAVFHDVTDLRRLETIRTDFVANVSHELRTPVTAIGTAAETLLLGALQHPVEAHEFVELIDRNAMRLRQLVDDLLDLSKIEAKNFRVAADDTEVWPILTTVAGLLQEQARKRRIVVTTAIAGRAGDDVVAAQALRAHVDRKALEQVLMNLLDNAIKYGGDGARVQMILQPRASAGDTVAISVIDNGPGIAPIHVERIFERFYRVDTGRSRELGGTGLGLSIVRHLLELMGATISVDSELGKGTTFTVNLLPARNPRVPGSSQAPPDATQASAA